MEPSEYFILVIFFILGAFSLISAIFNFNWYFETEGARFFVRHMGRSGARIFYALLGSALITCGVLGFLYWK